MTIAVAQVVWADDGGFGLGATTRTVTLTVAAGSYLHLSATYDISTSPTISSVASVPALTWTAASSISDVTDGQAIADFTSSATAGGSYTVTITFSGSVSVKGAAAAEITGSSGADAGKKAGQLQATPGTGSDVVSTGNTATLSAQPALISSFSIDMTGTNAPAAGTGFSSAATPTGWLFGTAAPFARHESKRVVSTAALAATFTPGGNRAHASLGVVFLEAAPLAPANTDIVSGTRRNRPGRGPYSIGRYYRPIGETAAVALTQISGALSLALADMSVASVATLAVSGAASIQLSGMTTSSAGTLAISAALAQTFDNMSVVAVANLALAGALAVTLDAMTLASAGGSSLSGVVSVTLGDVALSSAADLAIAGALAKTLDDVSLSSAGVGLTTGSGAASITLDSVTLAALGVLPISGTVGVSLAAMTLLAGGTVALQAVGDITLADMSLASASTFGDGGEGAEAVWSFVLPNGKTAGQNLSENNTMLEALTGAIEGSYTIFDLLKIIAAVAAGKSTIDAHGGGSATVVFDAAGGTDPRVTAEMQGSERIDVTLTP